MKCHRSRNVGVALCLSSLPWSPVRFGDAVGVAPAKAGVQQVKGEGKGFGWFPRVINCLRPNFLVREHEKYVQITSRFSERGSHTKGRLHNDTAHAAIRDTTPG